MANVILDQVKNFARVTVSTGYGSGVTTIDLAGGEGAKLPATTPYNLVWWNATDYPTPGEDPAREIVRVTARSTDRLTVTRAQESTADVNHNTASKTYKMELGLTAKTIEDIDSNLITIGQHSKFLAYPSIDQVITASTWTIIKCNTERYDHDGIYNNADPNYYLLPIRPTGYYHIYAQVAWSVGTPDTTKQLRAAFYSAYSGILYSTTRISASRTYETMNLGMTLGLMQEQVTLKVWHNVGGTVTVQSSGSGYETYFGAYQLHGGD